MRSALGCLVFRLLPVAVGVLLFNAPVSVETFAQYGRADERYLLSELPPSSPWERTRTVGLGAGLSLIGAQWRGAATFFLDNQTGPFLFQIQGTYRAGIYGPYEPDTDAWNDATRLLAFVRTLDRKDSGRFARLGPLSRTRLGTGMLVDFFSTQAVWDDRTIGASVHLDGRRAGLQSFTSDILGRGVVGARISLFDRRSMDAGLRSVAVGLDVVTDLSMLSTAGADSLAPHAAAVDVSMAIYREGDLEVRPHIALSRYLNYGEAVQFGLDVLGDGLVDAVHLRLRGGLMYTTRGFVPGYFGPFYGANNHSARILRSTVSSDGIQRFATTSLRETPPNTYLLLEFFLNIDPFFELWWSFKRAYHDLDRSMAHLRLFADFGQIRLSIGQDRGGLGGIFSTFEPLNDLTQLHFSAAYTLSDRLVLMLVSHYGYEVGSEAVFPTGGAIVTPYIVQRRFEPSLTYRIPF